MMLLVERQREIAALVDRERSVRVSNLARRFQVTEETIRRDLEKLEAEGRLVRSHGGAVSAHQSGREAPLAERETSFVPEKIALAREAVKLIEDGDTVIIDASTSALQMVRLIPDIALTVLTNSLPVCLELAARGRVRVINTGGELSTASMSFIGPHAEQMLSEYHVNRLFFSCTGVDFQHGLSDVNESQAMLKQKMLAVADHNYLLADRSKFGVRALKRFGLMADIDTIITNDTLDDSTIAELQALNANVLLAPTK